MRVAIALDEPAAAQHLDAEIVIDARQPLGLAEPMREMDLLDLMAQQPAAEARESPKHIERGEPEEGIGAHMAPAIDHAVERLEQTRPALDVTAEAGRQHAADFLHARMHELGQLEHLIVAQAHLLAHPRETPALGLDPRYPDHIVIGHGIGDVFCRLARQCPALAVATQIMIEGRDAHQAAQIFLAIAQVLELDDLGETGPGHVLRVCRHLVADAHQEILIARRELVGPLGDGDLGLALRRFGRDRLQSRIKGLAEGPEARLDALAAAPDRRFETVAAERQDL